MSSQIGDALPTEEEIAGAMPDPKFGIHVPDAAPCARAASLAGMLLRITRQPTWTALAQSVALGEEDTLLRLAEVHVTGEQQRLLDEWAAVIEVAVVEPRGTVCVCSGCGDWSVIGSRTTPSACRTTSGCAGKVTKAPRATRAKLSAGPTGTPVIHSEPDDLAAVIPLFGSTACEGNEHETPPFSEARELEAAQGGNQGERWTIDPHESFGHVRTTQPVGNKPEAIRDFQL